MHDARALQVAEFVTETNAQTRGNMPEPWDVWSGAIGAAIVCTCEGVCTDCRGLYLAIAREGKA